MRGYHGECLSPCIPPCVLSLSNASQVTRVYAKHLRNKTEAQLMQDLEEAYKAHFELRVLKTVGQQTNKLLKIKLARKNIARILHVLADKKKDELAQTQEGKRTVDKMFRPKLTRALRRALTPEQKSLTSSKIQKRRKHFPARRFAILDA